MELIKRISKGEALTWDDIDSNWANIEERLNASEPKELYGLKDITFTNTCTLNGASTLNLEGKIQLKESYTGLPSIKGCLILNGKIAKAGNSVKAFLFCNYPLTAGTETVFSTLYEVELLPSDYPLNLSVYLWDDKDNYALPYSTTIDECPCSYIQLTECAVSRDIDNNERVLTFGANVNGMGNYALQYEDALGWHTIANCESAAKRILGTQQVENSVPATMLNVRLMDNVTGAVSNEMEVNFSFFDTYAWHYSPTCECDGGQKLELGFYINKMPSSDIVLEYLDGTGAWQVLHTFTYAYPVNLSEIGGCIISIDVPEGTYDFRIKNLTTGNKLVVNGVAVPLCETGTDEITIDSASILCDATTGYLRKLIASITIADGSGDYKVQYNDGAAWIDMHSFSHATGTFDVDFYVSDVIAASSYLVRVVDEADATESNSVNVNMQYADAYEWQTEPTTFCDAGVQKIAVSLAFENVPESDLVLEVYSSGTWVELATQGFTTAAADTTLAGPITVSTPLVGLYNVRVRNAVTDTTLLAADVDFLACTI